MEQFNTTTIQEEKTMNKIENCDELINYLKVSKEDYISDNQKIGNEIAIEYMNDKIVDYEFVVLVENHYDNASHSGNWSNCYSELQDMLDGHPNDIWTDLAETFSQRVIGKSDTCLDAIAFGFLDGIMDIWSEIKDKVE